MECFDFAHRDVPQVDLYQVWEGNGDDHDDAIISQFFYEFFIFYFFFEKSMLTSKWHFTGPTKIA